MSNSNEKIKESAVRACLFAFLVFLFPLTASADWTAFLPVSAPLHFYAVDKEKDMLYRVAGTPQALSVVKSCPTIHGSVEGDKQAEGDLKTPEGVYFITHKITEKLDFMDYGPHAFGLNYPNPADCLRKKTGSGIWLHSKGRPIKEVRTRGCVAIEQADINELVPVLTPGTPVMIAQRLADPFFSPQQDKKAAEAKEAPGVQKEAAPADFSGEEKKVLSLSAEWSRLFHDAAGELFDLYDKKRWQEANREPFSVIEKKRIGEMSGKKAADTGEIRVLSGPGYWTSFFARKIRRNDSDVQGTQVLYWMKDDDGQIRVIGDFWIEGPGGEPAAQQEEKKAS